MTQAEVPRLEPDKTLDNDARARIETFVSLTTEYPGAMQTLFNRYVSYDAITEQARQLTEPSPDESLATQLLRSAGTLLLSGDDTETDLDPRTHREIEMALDRATKQQESGRLSRTDIRYIRLTTFAKLMGEYWTGRRQESEAERAAIAEIIPKPKTQPAPGAHAPIPPARQQRPARSTTKQPGQATAA